MFFNFAITQILKLQSQVSIKWCCFDKLDKLMV